MNDLTKMAYPVTKADQADWAEKIAMPLFEGEVDPLEFAVKIAGLKAALDEVTKNKEVKDVIIREISKSGKSDTRLGARLDIRELGVRYDYSGCGDPQMDALLAQQAELEKKLKERMEFLKHVPYEGQDFLDPDTGEVSHVYPPSRTASESYTITFKKQ